MRHESDDPRGPPPDVSAAPGHSRCGVAGRASAAWPFGRRRSRCPAGVWEIGSYQRPWIDLVATLGPGLLRSRFPMRSTLATPSFSRISRPNRQWWPVRRGWGRRSFPKSARSMSAAPCELVGREGPTSSGRRHGESRSPCCSAHSSPPGRPGRAGRAGGR